jgi:hypothetical protein
MSHYGKKVGDTVKYVNDKVGEVVELTANNNKIIVSCDGELKEWVAEWCDVVPKTEETNMKVEDFLNRVDTGILRSSALFLLKAFEGEEDEEEKAKDFECLKIVVPMCIESCCVPNQEIIEFSKKYL